MTETFIDRYVKLSDGWNNAIVFCIDQDQSGDYLVVWEDGSILHVRENEIIAIA